MGLGFSSVGDENVPTKFFGVAAEGASLSVLRDFLSPHNCQMPNRRWPHFSGSSFRPPHESSYLFAELNAPPSWCMYNYAVHAVPFKARFLWSVVSVC